MKKNKYFQNSWLLISSYFFYGYANIKMIPLLLGSTVVFYILGNILKKKMEQDKWNLASLLSAFGICLGVGILLYFKYLNFFADSLGYLLNNLGFNITWSTLHIIVPIGVSFFTFKLIGYIIDIYQETIEPSDNFIEFATYIAFFPTILSGPIDRPDKFLPQLRRMHSFDYTLAVDGCRQILWGMFIKMCIADRLAEGTDGAWDNYADMDGSALIVWDFLYIVQLYTDFSGYSYMAIGVGKLLGFRIARNFNHPLFARNIAEYWRKWHMSLTTWITDYIYMPLNFAFRNYGKVGSLIAVTINLVVIGLWHGANWTYVVFGLYYAVFFIPLVFSGSMNNTKELQLNKLGFPKIKELAQICITFLITSLGALIFRAPDVSTAVEYCNHIFKNSFMGNSINIVPLPTILLVVGWGIIEWFQRNKEHELQFPSFSLFQKRSIRWSIYIILILIIISYRGEQAKFIYFQF